MHFVIPKASIKNENQRKQIRKKKDIAKKSRHRRNIAKRVKCWQFYQEQGLSHISAGKMKWYRDLESSLAVPFEVKHPTALRPSIPTPRIERICPKDLYMCVQWKPWLKTRTIPSSH